MSKWSSASLGEVADLVLGKMLDQAKNLGEPLPYLGNVNVRWGEFDLHNLRTMRFQPHERERYGLKFGDIVMCEGGEPGRCAIWKNQFPGMMIQKALHRIRPLDFLDYRFLYYNLLDIGKNKGFDQYFTGSTIKHLSGEKLAKVEVNFPPLPTQQRIAGILSAYDELIENSQRRIKILESMARALYREWFVYFRYPGHESVPLVPSALGDIPQGWEVKNLGALLTYNRSATKPGPHLEGRRYVPIDCLPAKSLALLDAKPIAEAQSSLQLFETGDILFGAMRPYFHKVVVAPFPGVTRTTCFVFKPQRPDWYAYAAMTAFDEATVAYANAHSQGATIPYAVWDGALSQMPTIFPSPELLQRFDAVVRPLLTLLAQSFFVLGNASSTRDLLLPRLLSGQIEVSGDHQTGAL